MLIFVIITRNGEIKYIATTVASGKIRGMWKNQSKE